jgi:hypothetical protein
LRPPQCFDYVGAEEIRLAIAEYPRGTKIESIADLKGWIGIMGARSASDPQLVVATFVIELDGNLLSADRHSELPIEFYF